MPVMNVIYTDGALDPSAKEALAMRLTEVMLAMEGNARTPQGYAFASVLFHPMGQDDWWVGGRKVTAPHRFLVRVDIPEGYMDQSHKNEVHAGVGAAIVDSLGRGAREAPDTMVVINEITEGNWSAGARTISLDTLADAVGLGRSSARFAWCRDYFAAKARQYAAAGYPAGIGGLMSDAGTRNDAVAAVPRPGS